MKRKMIDATKATLQESAKDLARIEWHEACLPAGRCMCEKMKHRTEGVNHDDLASLFRKL